MELEKFKYRIKKKEKKIVIESFREHLSCFYNDPSQIHSLEIFYYHLSTIAFNPLTHLPSTAAEAAMQGPL